MGRLTNKRVVITGAGAGIGRAAAELFAREGARIEVAWIALCLASDESSLVNGAIIPVDSGASIF